MTTTTDSAAEAFRKMLNIIAALRAENGCPWDIKQTPQSFHPYLMEEYHELIEALNRGDYDDITDEMGDVLFIATFIAYMFEQQGFTSVNAVLEGVCAKMIGRHPHVFGDTHVKDAEDVIANWRKIKATEKNRQKKASLLDGIPRSLPALSRAQKLTKRAAGVGFDWTRPQDVLVKVKEELEEFMEAVEDNNSAGIREEYGDLLFVLTNVARHLDIDSETALNETSDKFEQRFRFIELRLKAQGKTLEEATLTEMDALWDEAKKQASAKK